LQAQLLAAEQQVGQRDEELRALRRQLEELRGSGVGDQRSILYEKVGLSPSCPEFILRVAHRAWRKHYHPDGLSDRPEAERRRAEEAFKNIENIFAAIQKDRPTA
jgi:DnaJ-class molecular chaperone